MQKVDQKNTDRLKYYKSTKFFKKFETHKRKVLALAGIHKWTSDSYKVMKSGAAVALFVTGSYMDHKGRTMYFTENHMYYPNYYTQALLTSPKKSMAQRKENFKALMTISREYKL